MPESLSREGYVLAQRSRAAQIAQDALSGRVGVLEAARWIVRGGGLELDPHDPDYAALALVEDETSALPIGSERANWASSALEQKAGEIARAEEWAREVAWEALRNVATRFGTA